VLYGQPIVDLRTDTVRRHELLVRMLSPTGELIVPAHSCPRRSATG
jgi:EAL domain-containing protein (putative c-di-GMP-specific phosphodiesterase class I)